MARPRKHKRICEAPQERTFNAGKKSKPEIEMTVDEFEVLRLIDYAGLTQQECARQMQVARTTVTSVYESARYKLSSSLIDDKAVVVEGGDYEICESADFCCGQCGKSRCTHCKHGKCDNCIGIFHEPGRECYAF